MKNSLLLHLIALLSLSSSSNTILQTAAASSLTIQIPSNNILPNPNVLPPNTHATLTTLPSYSSSVASSSSQEQQKHIISAVLTHKGEFHFVDLPSSPSSSSSERRTESYLLDIRCKEYIFAPYRVDIAADGTVSGVWETFRGNQWENRGVEQYTKPKGQDGSGRKLKDEENVVVQAKVLARRGFYEERPKFSPLSLLQNPMILLSVFALVATLGIPKILENMDPEMREEFEKQSASSPLSSAGRVAVAGATPGTSSGAGFDIAGWMAGTTSSPVVSGDARGSTTGRESGAAARRR